MKQEISPFGKLIAEFLEDNARLAAGLPPVDRTPFIPTEPEPENLATRGLRIMQENHDAVADGIEDALTRVLNGINILYGGTK